MSAAGDWRFTVHDDDDLTATFDRLEVDEANRLRHGAETMVCRWPSIADIEPAATSMVGDDGDFLTWANARNREVWAERHDGDDWRLVFQGPVTKNKPDPATDTVTSTVRGRWRYVERLINGMEPRANGNPDGYFDAFLTGWDNEGDGTAEATTATIWRGAHSARIEAFDLADTPSITAAATYESGPQRNYVDVRMMGLLEEGAQLPFGVAAATVEHMVTSPSGSAYAIVETVELTYPDGYQPDDDAWQRLSVRMAQWASYKNRYRIHLHGATHDGWASSGDPPSHIVGEVEWGRDENFSALAGQDLGNFLSAALEEVLMYLNAAGGPEWTKDVDEVGFELHDSMRELKADHVDLRSVFEDAVDKGLADVWVPLGTRTIMVRARRGAEGSVATFDASNAAIDLEEDAEDAATVVGLYADGQDEPGREEGFSRAVDPPHQLHRMGPAQPGSLPVDLDALAEEERVRTGGPLIVANVTPADGPDADPDVGYRGRPGGWAHVIEPGDTVTVDARTGVYTAGLADLRVDELVMKPLEDQVELRPASARKAVE